MANEPVIADSDKLYKSQEQTEPTPKVEITKVTTSTDDFTMGTPALKTWVLEQPVWDDLRFPVAAQNLTTVAGRLDYNFFNGGIDFSNTARYPNEPVSMMAQIPHTWRQETVINIHMHWLQTTANVPNWLVAYKLIDNNSAITKETDYTNHTFITGSEEFTYTSGNLTQITDFGDVTMTGYGISDYLHIVLFRDSNNTSSQFAGSDPSSATELVFELDIHYQKDTQGSRQRFIK